MSNILIINLRTYMRMKSIKTALGLNMLSVPILIIHAVLSSVLMILVIVFILLSPDEIEINQRDQLLHKLSHVLHLLSFMLNLFMVPFFSTLQYIIPRYLPLAVLSLPTTLFIAIYNGGEHVFGSFLPFVTGLISLYGTLQTKMCLVVISVYYWRRSKHNLDVHISELKTMLYTQLLILSLYRIGEEISVSSTGIIKYLYLVVVLIAGSFVSLLAGTYPVLDTAYSQNEYVLNCLVPYKNENIKDCLDLVSILRVENILYRFFRGLASEEEEKMQPEIWRNFEKAVSSLKVQEVASMLVEKILSDLREEDTLRMKILLIRAKDIFGGNFMSIIMLAEDLSSHVKKNESWADKYELFRLTSSLEKKYLLHSKANLETSIVMQTEAYTEEFYKVVSEILDTLVVFWQELRKNEVNETDSNYSIRKLLVLEESMCTHLQLIRRYKHSQKEEHIYEQVMVFLDCYRPGSTLSELPEDEKSKRIRSSNSIIVEGDIIVRVSFQILSEAMFRESDLIGERMTVIVPKEIEGYLSKEIHVLSQGTERIILPLLTSSKSIFLKRCRVFIFPQLFNGVKYMYTFEDCAEYDGVPLLLYNCHTDEILRTSSNFIDYFKLNAHSSVLDHCYAHELFENTDLTSKETRDLLEGGKYINTEFNLRKMLAFNGLTLAEAPHGEKNMSNINISLFLISEYSVEREFFFVLGLQTGFVLRSEKNFSMTQAITDRVLTDMSSSSRLGYEREEFFCKIPNSYESIIMEVQSKLRNPHRRNSLFSIHLLMAFVVLVVLAIIVMIAAFGVERAKLYNGSLVSAGESKQVYLDVVQASLSLLVRTHVQQLTQAFSDYNHGINVSALLTEYVENCSRLITDAQIILYKLPVSLLHKETLNLLFGGYNLETIRDGITIMNFLEEYKQSQTTFNISFLLRNFASLLEFADTFAVDNFFDSSHEQFAMLEKGIYLGLFGVVVLLTLAIYCHIYLIEQSVDTVYLLLSQIGKEELLETLAAVIKLKLSFKEIDYINMPKVEMKPVLAIESETSLQELCEEKDYEIVRERKKFIKEKEKEVKGEVQKNLSKKQDNKESANKDDNQGNRDTEKELQVLDNHELSKKTHVVVQTEPMQLKIRNGSFALVLMRSSIYIGFLLMCGLFLGLYLVRLETEKKSIKNILLYLQEIYDSSSTLTEDCATLYFKSLSTFLVVNTTAIPSSPLFILQTAFESPLPEFYNEYFLLQRTLLGPNGCAEISMKNDQLFEHVDCGSVFNGVLNIGFGQSSSYYRTAIEELLGVKLEDYFNLYRQGSSYPTIIEILYTQQALSQLLAILTEEFLDASEAYTEDFSTTTLNISLLAGLVLIFFVVLVLMFQKGLELRCAVAIKYFSIIPKNIMLKMKTTTFIRKNSILDRIDHL